jgi:DNA (cytosine-5)-methyltransferase 1
MRDLFDYLSVCSGIESVSVAWDDLARPVAFAEIDPFAAAVLAHRFPRVPNVGDMTTVPARVRSGEIAAPAVVVGGTPCQAFSIAGKRASLDDARGQLSLSFVEVANAVDAARFIRGQRACSVIWENVPGCLSTDDNAFGCLLGALAGEDVPLVPAGAKWSHAGYVHGPQRTVAWRVMDAEYFGVPQRRPRVFVVGSAATGTNPLAVLFDGEGVRRDSCARGSAVEDFTRAHDVGVGIGHFAWLTCITNSEGAKGLPYLTRSNIAKTVNNQTPLMSFVDAGGREYVRRLTPMECERLHGLPDDWTNVPWRGKPDAPDSLRYAALGNSMAVPVMRWIGLRLSRVMTDCPPYVLPAWA